MPPASVERPAVAVLETWNFPSPPATTLFLGCWRDDGTWADLDTGSEFGGLHEAIVEELDSPLDARVTLYIRSFTGTTTKNVRFDRGRAVELPVDPDYEPPRDEPAIEFETWGTASIRESWSTPIPEGWEEMDEDGRADHLLGSLDASGTEFLDQEVSDEEERRVDRESIEVIG